ncbi:zinc/iron-chelating domain-containing protein [Jeongeupia chitinilytica]|uniref:Zinc/iron-chelating domain-containing protein n=2 Tax=Jeongeupia chitinilytica TaxID=1041641 RepID=A0ABQ3GY93_9NEIS|nr:zinc/iron-chelating domain-containing protein [Jeongeupia chitinilytica]
MIAAAVRAAPSTTGSCTMSSACQTCGACCASFRVSFYWGETDACPGGTVPAELTTPINPWRVAMRGTETAPVHCIALQGEVGISVGCGIYTRRSSTCHEFTEGDERCNDARARHGLPALGLVKA